MGLDWRNQATWTQAGAILTIAWILLVTLITAEQPEHLLRNLVFVVPIVLWVIIIFVTRVLGVTRRDGNGKV